MKYQMRVSLSSLIYNGMFGHLKPPPTEPLINANSTMSHSSGNGISSVGIYIFFLTCETCCEVLALVPCPDLEWHLLAYHDYDWLQILFAVDLLGYRPLLGLTNLNTKHQRLNMRYLILTCPMSKHSASSAP